MARFLQRANAAWVIIRPLVVMVAWCFTVAFAVRSLTENMRAGASLQRLSLVGRREPTMAGEETA